MSRSDYLGTLYLGLHPQFIKAVELLLSKNPGDWIYTPEISQSVGLSRQEMSEFSRNLGRKGFRWVDTRTDPRHCHQHPRQIRIAVDKIPVILESLEKLPE